MIVDQEAATMAPTGAIREHFPALARVQDGHCVAYFDGPGGTQTPRCVSEAMVDYLLHHNANTHWAFATSQETDAVILQARQALADVLHARPEEIAFGANMTTLTFHLARAIGRGLTCGDEIIVTELDHHANVDPWKALVRECGVNVQVARMLPETGMLDWEHLGELLGSRTRVLAIGAASNALGTINDLAQATRMAHEAGALVFVDAVHLAPHRLIDVRAIDCDFLACSAYKFYGPHIGILYGKQELMQALDVPKLAPAPNEAAERFETGTQNHEGIAGAAAAVEFLAALAPGETRRRRLEAAFAAIEQREMALFARLWEGLHQLKHVERFGPPPTAPRTPTVSFHVAGHSSAEIARALAVRGLYVSHGDFYATTAIARLGHAHDGLVRVGISIYTTASEIERLLSAIADIAG